MVEKLSYSQVSLLQQESNYNLSFYEGAVLSGYEFQLGSLVI